MTSHSFALAAWRRRWTVLLIALACPLVALIQSSRTAPEYAASAQVLLSYRDLAGALTGTNFSNSVIQEPRRIAATQAQIAAAPEVAERTAAAVPGAGLTAKEIHESTTVESAPDSDFLVITATNGSAATASVIANAYAKEFTTYKQAVDSAAFVAARLDIGKRMSEMRARGDGGTALYRDLEQKAATLRTLETLQTSNALVVNQATDATKIRPTPAKSALMGAILGLLLAGGAVAVIELVDKHVRDSDEIVEALGVPLLGRLPAPPGGRRSERSITVRTDPASPYAEALRSVRTSLEFLRADRSVRAIMVTSARPGEGKSTTAVNLAAAYASGGQRAVVVDMDLRRPAVTEHFAEELHLAPAHELPGVTTIALGHHTVQDALIYLPSSAADGDPFQPGSRMIAAVPAGPTPPNPAEAVASSPVASMLTSLRQMFDVVIVDVPPLLSASDAVAITHLVDGIVLVANTSAARRDGLKEVRRLLDTCPARPLGVVITGEGTRGGMRPYQSRTSSRRASAA
ncbi:MAG: polysaccharide biosynthesis tyrosine autokinase [Thermoleophilia bacterium]|nr:polysaccharide biosynthesis tyrosine autokinase [Thermoleophilia bacterium]